MFSHNKSDLKLMLSIIALNQSDRRWLESQLSLGENSQLQQALSQLSGHEINYWLTQVTEENNLHDHVDSQLLLLARQKEKLNRLLSQQPDGLLPILKSAIGSHLASQVTALNHRGWLQIAIKPLPVARQQLILQSLIDELSIKTENN